MRIATLPAAHQRALCQQILDHPFIDGVRYNSGARSPEPPLETVSRLLEWATSAGKRLWIDLKGRQLRIEQWAVPTFGDIVLNHSLEVDLPAQLILRHGEETRIVAINGRSVFVDPPPATAVGQGQAVNVRGANLRIDGYLTPDDHAYLQACRELGVLDVMLSFVEQADDISTVRQLLPGARCVLKIESMRGLAFVQAASAAELAGCQLMAARDDLYVNIEPSPAAILPALALLVQRDPEAICASRLFAGLEHAKGAVPSIGDLTDLCYMQQLGYKHFMLSDGICQRRFADVMQAWQDFHGAPA